MKFDLKTLAIAMLITAVLVLLLINGGQQTVRDHSSAASALGAPIVFAQLPSTINGTLPPSDIISWVETNQSIDLEKAKQALANRQICDWNTFTETNTFIECYRKYYPYSEWSITKHVNVYIRIYRDGLIVTYVPHIDNETLVLSLWVSSDAVGLETDSVLWSVLYALNITGVKSEDIHHGTSIYRGAKYMKILWCDRIDLSGGWSSSGYEGKWLGSYTIYDNSTVLKGWLIWLLRYDDVYGYRDDVYLEIYYNSSILYSNVVPYGDFVKPLDMVSAGLLNVGNYNYRIERYCDSNWIRGGYNCDYIEAQLVMVILLKG